MTTETYTPRRSTGETTAQFQPKRGKYSDPGQVTDSEQIFYDLEDLAVELIIGGHYGWADRTRNIARRIA